MWISTLLFSLAGVCAVYALVMFLLFIADNHDIHPIVVAAPIFLGLMALLMGLRAIPDDADSEPAGEQIQAIEQTEEPARTVLLRGQSAAAQL